MTTAPSTQGANTPANLPQADGSANPAPAPNNQEALDQLPVSRAIKYIWLCNRPRNSHKDILWLAWQTAMSIDPNITQILVRSLVHATTGRGTNRVPAQPHITIAFKTPELASRGQDRAAHGYTASVNSYLLTSAEFWEPQTSKEDWDSLRCEYIVGKPPP